MPDGMKSAAIRIRQTKNGALAEVRFEQRAARLPIPTLTGGVRRHELDSLQLQRDAANAKRGGSRAGA